MIIIKVPGGFIHTQFECFFPVFYNVVHFG